MGPQPIANTNTRTCPKCGKFGKSGKTSCCAPGGTWYKNCGGAANAKVAYTWPQGVKACKNPSKPAPPETVPETTAPASLSVCPKCGVNRKGKSHCCGRGGSWFGKCGNPGKKAHTWFEGFQACHPSNVVMGKQWNPAQQTARTTCTTLARQIPTKSSWQLPKR